MCLQPQHWEQKQADPRSQPTLNGELMDQCESMSGMNRVKSGGGRRLEFSPGL